MYLEKYYLQEEYVMDNPMFVNEYSRTKDTMKEIYGYWYFRRPLSVALYSIVALNLVMRLIFLLTDGYIDPLNTFRILFIAALYSSLYFIQVHSASKKDSQLVHGEDLHACIIVASDRFYPSPSDERVYIELSSVNYAFLTKNYVVLVMKTTRLMLIFHKDSFTLGTSDGFIAFLKEKGIKVKGKKN